MKIGIVIATLRELKQFLESNYKIEELSNTPFKVFKTIVNNNEVYAINSGVGASEASAATQYIISIYNVELILNYGVTGAIDKSLKLNELFVVNKCVNRDFDTSFIDPVKKYQLDCYDDIYIPMSIDMIEFAKTVEPSLRDVICASGDSFVCDTNEKIRLHNETKASIVDMEIAAIARICDINKIKCLSIKSISDEFIATKTDYLTNATNSANKAFNLFNKILQQIK